MSRPNYITVFDGKEKRIAPVLDSDILSFGSIICDLKEGNIDQAKATAKEMIMIFRIIGICGFSRYATNTTYASLAVSLMMNPDNTVFNELLTYKDEEQIPVEMFDQLKQKAKEFDDVVCQKNGQLDETILLSIS